MNKTILYIIVTVLLMAACASHRGRVTASPELSDVERRQVTYMFGEASRLYATDSIAEAYDLLYNTLRLNNRHAPTLSLLATYEWWARNYEVADSMLALALAIDPMNVDYIEQEVAMAMNSGDPTRILEGYQRLAIVRPHNVSLLWNLSQIYIQGGQYDSALEVLEQIEQIQGVDPRVTAGKGYIHMALRDTIGAVNDLKALVADSPSNLNYMVTLGTAYNTMLHDADSALIMFDRVAAIDSTCAALHTARLSFYEEHDTARYHQYLNRLLYAPDTDEELRSELMLKFIDEHNIDADGQQAITQMLDSLTSMPHEGAMRWGVYASYLALTDAPTDSINYMLNKVVDIDPSNIRILMMLLENYITVNDTPEIMRVCDIGINNHPHEALFYYYSAIGYYIEGDSVTALDRLTTGCEHISDDTAPGQAAAMYSLQGDILHSMGMRDESYEAYEACLSYNPNDILCLNNYAYYLSIEGGDLRKAEEMSYRTIRREPRNRTYLDTYAWILFLQERYDEAAQYMDRLMLEVDINARPLPEGISSVVLEHAADIYEKCGDTERAQLFRNAASSDE